jgi:hypothetical protein
MKCLVKERHDPSAGYGVICGATVCVPSEIIAPSHQPIIPYPLLDGTFQASHVWLPSSGPSGTNHLRPGVDAHGQPPDPTRSTVYPTSPLSSERQISYGSTRGCRPSPARNGSRSDAGPGGTATEP